MEEAVEKKAQKKGRRVVRVEVRVPDGAAPHVSPFNEAVHNPQEPAKQNDPVAAQQPALEAATAKSAEKVASKPAGTGYSIARAEGRCHVCGRVIEPGEKLSAALRETPVAMERIDICLGCTPGFDRAGLLGFWQTTMHPPAAKKQVFVDDDVLCELFERLSSTEEPAKINFRFVLGLILMRKRRVVYDSTRQADGKEIWVVHFKGREERMDLVNPKLDEQQVGDVSAQLGEILSADL